MGKLKKGGFFMGKEKPRMNFTFMDGGRKSTIAKKQRQFNKEKKYKNNIK